MIVAGIALAALTRIPARTTPERERVGDFVRQDAHPWIFDSLRALDGLLSNVDLHNDIRPSGLAYFKARDRLIEVSAFVAADLKPTLTLDGEGGLDIEWENKDRVLMISCRGNPNQRDYIYFEDIATHGGKDYSRNYLADRLYWLLKG